MPADENVKEALEKLEKMGYDIEEYDQGYIACILTQSKEKAQNRTQMNIPSPIVLWKLNSGNFRHNPFDI